MRADQSALPEGPGLGSGARQPWCRQPEPHCPAGRRESEVSLLWRWLRCTACMRACNDPATRQAIFCTSACTCAVRCHGLSMLSDAQAVSQCHRSTAISRQLAEHRTCCGRYVLKNLVRDWSKEGAAERSQSYRKICQELRERLGPSSAGNGAKPQQVVLLAPSVVVSAVLSGTTQARSVENCFGCAQLRPWPSHSRRPPLAAA